ncbi:protein-glutamate O-methyltransferase CheR [Ectothiorhodospiraceae bacterium WFHF3C12]|nr:protein-glutamate O-methyltransferase CheR [Ectothiorhodospiraceae bacterium WFHF3C12]
MLAPSIRPDDYQRFRQFLEQTCGIVLGENKQYLVSSRLGQLMARQGISELGVLVDRLDRPGASALRGEVIEAMTTNETSWFRDIYPFHTLNNELFPRFQAEHRNQIRVWSAGCSSGQEVYSILMALDEYRQGGGRMEGEVVGTDISPNMIERGKEGIYAASEVRRGLSEERRRRYFDTLSADRWQVKSSLRHRATFRVHNLLDSYSPLGRFDAVFCRNVLIYFSMDSREDIIRRIAQTLRPGGYLIVGASESVARNMSEFEMIRCQTGVVYRLRDSRPVLSR